MNFKIKTMFRHKLNDRWDWSVSVFPAEGRHLFAKFIIQSSLDFETEEEARADRDAVLKSLNLPNGNT